MSERPNVILIIASFQVRRIGSLYKRYRKEGKSSRSINDHCKGFLENENTPTRLHVGNLPLLPGQLYKKYR